MQPGQLRCRFAQDAQELYVSWGADLEPKVHSGCESSMLMSHLSKYRSLMPSLAVLFELADLAHTGFEGFEGFEGGERSQRPSIWIGIMRASIAHVVCG